MQVYPENNGIEATAEFETVLGRPTIPGTAEYRILCVTTRKVLQTYTPVTPVETYNGGTLVSCKAVAELDGNLLGIQNRNNRRETKRLWFYMDRGTPRARSKSMDWIVQRDD